MHLTGFVNICNKTLVLFFVQLNLNRKTLAFDVNYVNMQLNINMYRGEPKMNATKGLQ